jgi:hypothetical protein
LIDDSLQAITDDMDAREIESLSMLSRGFQELRDVNPELSYNVILDILTGLNEYVASNFYCSFFFPDEHVSVFLGTPLYGSTCRPPRDSSHIDVSRGRAR